MAFARWCGLVAVLQAQVPSQGNGLCIMTSEKGLQQFKIIFTPDDTEISRSDGGQYKVVHDGQRLDSGR